MGIVSVINEYWPLLLTLVNILLAVMVTVHAVLNKRDTRAAIGWTALAWLAPMIGPLLYYWLGINRIYRRAVRLGLQDKIAKRRLKRPTADETRQIERATRDFPNMEGFVRVSQMLTRKELVPGNRIEPLVNGDETFPAMISAISSARKSVSLLSYIFDDDMAGQALFNALAAAHDRGVEVRVLVDDVGSRYSTANIVDRLKAHGVPAARFLPARFLAIPLFSNLRNHRKILVTDGKTGFTGGTNIREGHWLSRQPDYPVECLHFELSGPVVAHLQETFAIDWAFTTGETLSGRTWFPPLMKSGGTWARGIAHGPDEEFETLSKVIFAALASAQNEVKVFTPYFLPDTRLIEALSIAAMRGVRVHIYVPSTINIPVIKWATHALLPQILRFGCRVFETEPPFDHSKLMLVDGTWALIGSTNWDARSLRLNFEFNVECIDADLVYELNMLALKKAAKSTEVTLADLQKRSAVIRLRDGFARLFSPYL